jgi:molybdopterin-synthase adenylyltransferase
MESLTVRSYSIAVTETINTQLTHLLIRDDGEEDLTFALYSPSEGTRRTTALLHTLLLPQEGERQRHGNVSFNRDYLERVCREALAQGCGVAFLHSHPFPGWQGMSPDDIRAETYLSKVVEALTDLPLVGLTVGSDGTWSARTWPVGERVWCESVRVLGEQLTVHFNDRLIPVPSYQEFFKRTRTVWGEHHHQQLARLRVGIVGLGSVGSLVAEMLARMGMTHVTLIDFDVVKPHNLDRLLGATKLDLGSNKIDIAERQMRFASTAAHFEIIKVPYSLAEEKGYKAALDCDVLFSCVDRPRARSILNHFAYAHLIPVIDGGIDVRFKAAFSGVDWQVQTVGPGRACLKCLGCFDPADVDTERAGLLDDPSYMRGLPDNHRFKRNENVFPFSANLASLEILQLIALATGVAGMTDFGVQRYRYIPGLLESDSTRMCQDGCSTHALVAQGDRYFSLAGKDVSAEKVRAEAENYKEPPQESA